VDLASPLLSFDAERDSPSVAGILDSVGTPIAGVRTAGLVNGWIDREDLEGGRCVDHMRPFEQGQVLDEDDGLQKVLEVLDAHALAFVATLGTVDAVVRREDIQKPPARMWLFGMITLIEMQFGRWIEEKHPNESWRRFLSPARLAKARELRAERRRRGQHPELLDCLQLADKLDIVVHDDDALREMRFSSRRQAKQAAKELQSLRNNLAHTQDIVSHDWPMVVRLARRTDRIVGRG
jgi:hypothetical protein